MGSQSIEEYLSSKCTPEDNTNLPTYRKIQIPYALLEKRLEGSQNSPILIVKKLKFAMPWGGFYTHEESIEHYLGVYQEHTFDSGEIVFQMPIHLRRLGNLEMSMHERNWFENKGKESSIKFFLFDLLHTKESRKNPSLAKLRELYSQKSRVNPDCFKLAIFLGDEVENFFYNGSQLEPLIPIFPEENHANIVDLSYIEAAKILGLQIPDRFLKIQTEKDYSEKVKIIDELKNLIMEESSLEGKVAEVFGQIDTRPRSGGHIMYATRPEIPGMDEDDARVITMNERQRLREISQSISSYVRRAMQLGMDKQELTIPTEIPGQVIDVKHFIHALCQKYEVVIKQD